MKILFITQWFEPEPTFKGLGFAKALSARGHEVEVVTGFPNYPTGKIYPGYRISLHKREEVDGIVVHRMALYPSHDESSVKRILNYLSFAFTAMIFLCFHARRFDVIYSYPQVTVGLAATVGGWMTRRPVVLDIQDLWPDTVLRSGMAGTRFMKPVLDALCNFVHRRSTRIIAQSQGIRSRLIERGVPAHKIAVAFNWADEDAAKANGICDLTPYKFEGRFNIVYGGNLGRMQALDTLVRAARIAARDVPNLHLLLIGDGMEHAKLVALVDELKASNVTIARGVPRMHIGDVFAAADVLVLHLSDDPLFEITIPSKTQFYMAMGKPILIGVKGEAARIVTDARAGIAVAPQDDQAMAAAMVQMARLSQSERDEMGKRGRDVYRQMFSFDAAITVAEDELRRAIAERPRGGKIA